MGNLEANAWRHWPTRSREPTPRARGGGLTNITDMSMLKKCDTARCQTCHVTVILWFPFPSFSCSSLLVCFLFLPFRILLSKYGSFIYLRTNHSWTLSFAGRPHVAIPPPTTTWSTIWSKAWSTSCTSPSESTCDRGSPISTSTHEQSPWWRHGCHDLRCVTFPQQDGRRSPVHLQCLTQYPPSRILHGVQPSLLHQPAHLVHLGSLPTPVLHGH